MEIRSRRIAAELDDKRGTRTLGFITNETSDESGKKLLNIFIPTSPNPTSGFLLFEPREKVEHLEMTVEEGLKMVVSGGIVTPPDPETKQEDAAPPAEPVAEKPSTESGPESGREGGAVVEPAVSRSADT